MSGGVVCVRGGYGMRLGWGRAGQPPGGASADGGGSDPFDAVGLPVYRRRVRPGATSAFWVRGERILRLGAGKPVGVRRDRGSGDRSVSGERRTAGLSEPPVCDADAREAPDRSRSVQRHGDHRAVQSVIRVRHRERLGPLLAVLRSSGRCVRWVDVAVCVDPRAQAIRAAALRALELGQQQRSR